MTRGKQIIEEAKLCASANTQIIGDWGEHYLGFIHGAKWADAHPHWISVEDYSTDELPPLIDKNNPYGESVQVLFVVVLDGVQFINKGTFDYDTGVWHSLDMQCSFCKENITHWMPLPQLPTVAKNATVKEKGGEE